MERSGLPGENGKVPATARYGRYAAFAWVSRQGISVKLSHKQAEYTGKEIKPPKVTFKKTNPDCS